MAPTSASLSTAHSAPRNRAPTPPSHPPAPPVPRPGDLVSIRDRRRRVRSVAPSLHDPDQPPRHLITLDTADGPAALTDEGAHESLSIIWELEPSVTLHQALAWPAPTGLAEPEALVARLDAQTLDRSSPFLSTPLLSLRHSAVTPGPWQLVPAARAARMPRVSLLLADDTGLGKTLQAALVIRELLARRRIRRVLILTPASLQTQWQRQLERLIGLDATIIDREALRRLRREHGRHLNPWTSANRLITSIDFLKREDVLHRFLAAVPRAAPDPSPWDLLIIDEAHNVAPPHHGPDSERSRMVRQLAGLFPHRLFLTATPHNGHRDSFVGLLELLDPLRFRRGRAPEPRQLQSVLVRRTRADVRAQLTAAGQHTDDASQPFVIPERRVHAIPITLDPDEQAVHDALDRWLDKTRESKLANGALRLVGTILKKALLSSIPALDQVFSTHLASLASAVKQERRSHQQAFDPAWFEPEDPEPALAAVLESLPPLPEDLRQAAAGVAAALQTWRIRRNEAKRQALLELLDRLAETCDSRPPRACKLLVFTESRVTLHELRDLLSRRLGPEGLVVLHGEVEQEQRRCRLAAFRRRQGGPRVLLATDAASEGLDIQQACHHLLHYDIPWNPARLEQRNGRIDRLGQPDPTVHCHHFVAGDHHDSQLLDLALRKIDRARQDLGSFSRVLALQLEDRLLRRVVGRLETGSTEPNATKPNATEPNATEPNATQSGATEPGATEPGATQTGATEPGATESLELASEPGGFVVETDPGELEQVRRLLQQDQLHAPANAERLRRIINQALALDGAPALERRGQVWLLRRLPRTWRGLGRPLAERLFRFPHGPRHERAATLHLAHPLMRCAIARLQRDALSDPERQGSGRLALASGPRRLVLVALRRLWTNAEGHRLLENGITLAGRPPTDPDETPFDDLIWRSLPGPSGLSPGDLWLPENTRLLAADEARITDALRAEHAVARDTLTRELRRRARLEQVRSQSRLQALDHWLSRRRVLELADHARELKRRLDLLGGREDPSQLLLWSALERRELDLHTACLSARRDTVLQRLRRDETGRRRLELHPSSGVQFDVLAVIHVLPETP